MNLLKNLLIFSFLTAGLNACGVKGDPLPPIRPAELGRGRPTYKRATESLKIENSHTPNEPKRPAVHPRDDDEDEDDQ